MSVTPAPATVAVSYQTPNARALSAAQRTGLAALISAILLGVLPLGITFLQHGDFSRASMQAMLTAAGVVVLTVILAYVQKLSEAKADDAKSAPVTPPEPPASPAAIFAPPLTPDGLHDILTMATMLQRWSGPVAPPPEPPPATIAHRIVTSTPPILSADAPVKRSHHAAKAPAVVAPLDVHSDS
jgi:hypothetical protein